MWIGRPVEPPYLIWIEEQLFTTTTRGPFARNFVNGVIDTSDADWIPTNLTQADIAAIRDEVESLRPDFAHIGRGAWLDHFLRVLEVVGRHTDGARNLFAEEG
jgi:hypothetical protein